jgi:hypothetical protein
LSNISNIFKTQLQTLGKGIMHSKFPNDFELYMFALELVDMKTQKTINYFVFPIMPSNISISRNFQNNIKKTQGGINFSKTTVFQPFQLKINGSFGRNFKFNLGNNYNDLIAFFDKDKENNAEFNNSFKTGYGSCKLLEKIILNSRKISETGPFGFYAYNLAFNQKLIVEASSLEFSQDMSSNMIWNYSLSFDVIGDLDNIYINKEQDSLSNRLNFENILSQQTKQIQRISEII